MTPHIVDVNLCKHMKDRDDDVGDNDKNLDATWQVTTKVDK